MPFDFEDLNLVPKYCVVESRSECDTVQSFGPRHFTIPVVPANMECIVDEEIATKLATRGYFYILHRFRMTPQRVLSFARHMQEMKGYLSLSVGVNEDSYTLLQILQSQGIVPEYLTVDIAHGHAIKMQRMIQYIRQLWGTQVFVIAGNVSTPEAVQDLERWGADAIKVGIGPGSACTTYHATGFGSRGMQASVIQECAKARTTAKIIADGGIQHPGDIAKALALGADFVMVGGMFAGLEDSPTPRVIRDGVSYKEFWGSASEYQSGKQSRIEGIKKKIPMESCTVLEKMAYLKECLQSAISYAGGSSLKNLQTVSWVVKSRRE
jgi:GMP reductase